MLPNAHAAPRLAAGLTIEEITEPAALQALEPDWRALFDADPEATPFQSPAWLLAWRRAFLTGPGLWTLAVRRAGQLVGLAPLFVHPAPDGGGQLTLLGNGLSDRQALLARPQETAAVVHAVGRRIAERGDLWDQLDFRDLPAGSPLLAMEAGQGLKQRLEPEPPCPVLALDADPLAALPRRRRGDLARCARRLQDEAPLRLVRADGASRRAILDALARLHGARWRARGEAGVLAEAAVFAFHDEATRGLLAQDLLRLEALWCGERIIAAHYAMRRGVCGYSYLHAFDPAYAACGPGWLLMARSLEAAHAEGVRRFDFLRGREPYKYAWGASDRPQLRRRAWR